MKTMTRIDAMHEVIRDARAERMSRSSYVRMCRALNVLGLTRDEQAEVLQTLEYLDHNGNLRPSLAPKAAA